MSGPHRIESDSNPPKRFKSGLETPLKIRFLNEDLRIVFAPPEWYDRLVLLCVLAGSLMAISGLLGLGPQIFLDPVWRIWTGAAVVLAGVWAALSNERMWCDVRARTYVRLEGQGPLKSVSRGPLADLDAIVLLAESTFAATGPAVTYRLVVHWKNAKLPLLVISQSTFPHSPGTPLNYASANLVQQGLRTSKAIGVPFFDNSYFHSPAPLRPI